MKRLLHSLLLCLLLGAPAWATSGLDGPRAEARAARTQVRELRERQQSLRAQLNTLAGRIESLKAEQQGRLVAGPELESALRHSQELSGQLTGLAQSLAGAEAEAERRNLTLHTALSEELSRVRAAWEATSDRTARAGLIARLRDLRAERDAVRAALPPSQAPALNPTGASDDPEDLLEQADALRDSEDKVRQRLHALRARITEVREEHELDRRMSDFLGEDSLFDEQDRHMRLRRDSSDSAIRAEATPPSRGGLFSGTPRDVHAQPEGGASAPSVPVTVPGTPDVGDGKGTPSTPPARASDSRPQVGTQRAQALASGDLDNLRDLEAEAARLESFAHELDSRADTLERRARELR
jgi:hypothetical protein